MSGVIPNRGVTHLRVGDCLFRLDIEKKIERKTPEVFWAPRKCFGGIRQSSGVDKIGFGYGLNYIKCDLLLINVINS